MKTRKPHTPRDPAVVSRVMAAVRSTDNVAETKLRLALWSGGLRYRRYRADLPGRPDVVFGPSKVAVFVDGDFWHARVYVEHGLSALRASLKTKRADWWVAKLLKNARRDVDVTRELQARGYLVIRVWERDILKSVASEARRISRVVKNRRSAMHKG